MSFKIKSLWEKFRKFILYLKNECRDWRTLVLFVIVMAVVYSPVWLCYLLYFLFDFKWALIAATSVLAFWAGPFTPFFPLCIAITLGIKRFFTGKNKTETPEE